MEKHLITKALNKYSSYWPTQAEIFDKLQVENPYPNPELIKINQLTTDEKSVLAKLADQPEEQVFRGVNELLGNKLLPIQHRLISLNEAKNKLKIDLVKEIPIGDTCSLRSLFFAIPSGITHPPITQEELKWLYIKGYLPHLYWNKGKPRFHSRMWFIIDFIIKQAREKIGIGINYKFSDWTPNWIALSNYIRLTTFMYNSWNIGAAILDYTDKEIRQSGLRDEKFRIAMHGLQKLLWINEGKVLADELLNNSNSDNRHFNIFEYFRDIFALLAFETFPGSYLIDLYHNPEMRKAVMFTFEPFLRIRTYSMGVYDVNTYSKEMLSSNYGLLFSAMDWALSMRDGVNNRSVADIVKKHRWRESQKDGKIPCRICGALFKPVRKIDITCGKEDCIKKNKYLSKRKNIEDKILPLVD